MGNAKTETAASGVKGKPGERGILKSEKRRCSQKKKNDQECEMPLTGQTK